MSDEHKTQDELEVVTPRTRSWIRGGFGCGIAAIISVIWIIGISLIADYYMSMYQHSFGWQSGVDQFGFSLIVCLVAWFLIDRQKTFREAGLVNPLSIVPGWILGTAFGMAGACVAIMVISLSGSATLDTRPPVFYDYGGSGLEVLFIFFLFSGSEEFFSRGLLYPLLRRYVGLVWSVLLSSLVFSLLHLGNNAFGILPAIDIFFAGVLLALLREYTGSLWLAWGAHLGWNFGLAAAGLPVSGYTFQIEFIKYRISTQGPNIITGGEFGPEGGLSGIFANIIMVAVVIILIILKKRNCTITA
ncbi:MAG: CPBP family intramembrane metalloprotease [bacterium]|nr:CPBP family intramembrane metalloprotease [bacterium]